ncbi:TIGR02117 family protein [Pararhodobacter zhoushanensis]|uniref:TIGR02117 family protein n=1 Tax=Pararhodobacter zhoushanensis TaxID=2479545 RepID=A0ABT3GVS8_9RHOB|nr:TIGR02117 family protein [Pararhodobacter zhoushanensis]MCW1931639.1 TIGR02117 family protein [Pararhodobacter zhoushanensis]
MTPALRRLLIGAAGVVAAPVLLILAYLAAGTLGGLMPGRTAELAPGGTNRVLLVPGPIHTDILLPLDDSLMARFGYLEPAGVPLRDPRARWLVVGWGSRAFYTTAGSYADITAAAVWRAATGDSAVLRFDVWGGLPEAHGFTDLSLSDAQYGAMLDGIERAVGPVAVAIAHPGFTGTDAFFEATGYFTLFRTCNVWVGDLLRASGIRTGIWTPFTWSLP